MPISIVQSAKNSTAYQVNPLVVTLPHKTTAGSYLAVIIEAQKSPYPYNTGVLAANTPPPTIKDDKSNTYTLVDKIVNVVQDATSGSPPVPDSQTDASGYFPSLYIYVSSAAATVNTQNISISAFHPDVIVSPPVVNGRPVFNGGLQAQVFEIAGLSTGVDVHGNTQGTGIHLGSSLITTSATALILEVGVLLDSGALTIGTGATSQYQAIIYGGSSHYVVQTTAVTGATASSGFKNPLLYKGAVVAVSLK